MIHFRLTRSFRVAVDFLTFSVFGLLAVFRSTSFILRTIHASAAIPHASIPLPTQPLWIPLPTATRLRHPNPRSLRHKPGTSARRLLASLGLVVALSLEVCGCSPVRYIDLTVERLGSSHAIREAGRPEEALSFYDPSDAASASTPLTLSDLPTGRRSLPADVKLAEAKPLPWPIPESVFFVYTGQQTDARSDDSRPHEWPAATAFVLSVPVRERARYVRFLVTARHVVDPQWAQCSSRNPESIDVRLNRRAGGFGYATIPLRTRGAPNFYTPADTTADLAVIPLDQNLISRIDEYKFMDVPYSFIPTDAEMRLVHTDQPVMTARFSPRPSDESSSYPVFDAGSLSRMPTEPVGVQCGVAQHPQTAAKLLHVWFINVGVPQGVSGAPVYTSIARGTQMRKGNVLLGIQSAAWPDNGVAGITPSAVLADLIQTALRGSKLKLDFYRGAEP